MLPNKLPNLPKIYVANIDACVENMWPPNSPDLNPMGYYVWGAVQANVNDRPLVGRVALQEKISRAMGQMKHEVVARACGRFRPRLEGIIKAGGGYTE